MVRRLVLGFVLLAAGAGAFLRFRNAAEAVSFHGQNYYSLGLNLKKEGVLGYPSNPKLPTAYRSPLYPSFIASLLAPGENPFPSRVLHAQALLGALAVLALYVLGAAVAGPLAGLLAAWLYALDPGQLTHVRSLDIEHFYGLLLIASASGLALWAARPGRAAAWGLGLLLGLSLLCRSPLVFFPAVLAVWLAWRRLPPAGIVKGLLPVVLGASLPLVPWVLRNAAHFRAFVPLERHAGVCNLYTASQGMIETWLPSEAYALLQLENRTVSSMSMEEKNAALRDTAVSGIMAGPGAYAWSTARRLVYYLRFHPLLWGLALAAFLFRRRFPLAVPLLWLSVYLLVIHSLLSVEERYLAPLMPVLFVLASATAAGAAALLGRAGWSRLSLTEPDRGPSLSRMVLASLGLFGSAALVCFAQLAAEVRQTGWRTATGTGSNVEVVFPAPSRSAAGAEEEAGPLLTAAIFHNDRGIQRYLGGDLPGAEADFRQAMTLLPPYVEPRLSLAAIVSRKGRHREALALCEEAGRWSRPSSDEALLEMAGYDFGRNRLALYAAAQDCQATEFSALGRRKESRLMFASATGVRLRVADVLRNIKVLGRRPAD